jgi:hypothetical protein
VIIQWWRCSHKCYPTVLISYSSTCPNFELFSACTECCARGPPTFPDDPYNSHAYQLTYTQSLTKHLTLSLAFQLWPPPPHSHSLTIISLHLSFTHPPRTSPSNSLTHSPIAGHISTICSLASSSSSLASCQSPMC